MIKYKHNLKDMFIFEFKSLLGRSLLSCKPLLNNNNNYLNLGCGNHYAHSYVNADFFGSFKFWKKTKRQLEWQLDLRYALKCNDNTFDGIYTEHTLEHLYPDDAKKLLKELFRILKKDAIIRITVPDIEKYVSFYNKKFEDLDFEAFSRRYTTGCHAIRNITQNYFHLSVWDFNELKKELEDAGFSDIKKMEFGYSQDANLKLDQDERRWETLYIEAHKT